MSGENKDFSEKFPRETEASRGKRYFCIRDRVRSDICSRLAPSVFMR